MADLATIRAAIKARLETVSGIGRVHDYERFAKETGPFLAMYRDTTTGRIAGCWFDRASTREVDLDIGTVRRIHSWRCVVFLGLDDADETAKTFQTTVEAIATAFRTGRTLSGAVLDLRDMTLDDAPSGVQIDAIESVLLAGVLCHRATLRLTTETTEP